MATMVASAGLTLPKRQSWRKEAPTMFLMISKGPRKSTRSRSKRYRAKLKAKNRDRRNRVYCRA